MEQNTLIPAAGGTAGDHNIKAVAAMFGRSPLCFWVSEEEFNLSLEDIGCKDGFLNMAV